MVKKNTSAATTATETYRSPTENAMISLMHARVPVMLVGAPGTSKTATVRALAKELGYNLLTIVPSRMEPQDISGFPTKGTVTFTDHETGLTVEKPITEYAPQWWQHDIMANPKTILFFDEYSNAHPSTRASLLSFIQDRQFPNGEYMPKEVMIIGAMNPTDSAADGYELDKATSNRIAFLAWEPSFQNWVEGIKNNWGDDTGMSDEERKWRLMISKFIKENPSYLHRENDKKHGTVEAYGTDMSDSSAVAVLEYAWASRRSWDNLARALGNSVSPSTYVEDVIMRGIIGADAATRFRRWVEENSKLNVKKIISAPDEWDGWDDLNMTDATTILTSAIDGANKKNINNVIRMFEILVEKDKAAFAAPYIHGLAGCHHKFTKTMPRKERDVVIKSILATISKYSDITRNEQNTVKR